MSIVVKADLVCDVCGKTTKGSITIQSPVDWVVKSPDAWTVEHRTDEDEEAYINITCCDDCQLQLHATAQA